MTELGEVLEALYLAPRCDAFHATFQLRIDWPRLLELPPRPGTMILVAGSVEVSDVEHEVWWDRASGRERVDCDGAIVVRDPSRIVRFHPSSDAIRSPVERRSVSGWPEMLWTPRALLAQLEFEHIELAGSAGVAGWRVTATRCGDEAFSLGSSRLGGSRFDLVVDRATGILVRFVAADDDGRVLVEASCRSIEVLDAVPARLFDQALPPGVAIRSIGELRLERLAAEGFDVTGIDPDDAEAIAAIPQRQRDRQLGPSLAHYVPDGAPPADPASAEADIAHAFASFTQTDGDRLTFVEASRGLVAALQQAQERFPDLEARLTVTEVKFLNDHEAVVVASIDAGDGRTILPGSVRRAVLERGVWKLARSSFAEIMSAAGVRVPPPLDD